MDYRDWDPGNHWRGGDYGFSGEIYSKGITGVRKFWEGDQSDLPKDLGKPRDSNRIWFMDLRFEGLQIQDRDGDGIRSFIRILLIMRSYGFSALCLQNKRQWRWRLMVGTRVIIFRSNLDPGLIEAGSKVIWVIDGCDVVALWTRKKIWRDFILTERCCGLRRKNRITPGMITNGKRRREQVRNGWPPYSYYRKLVSFHPAKIWVDWIDFFWS